MHAHEEQMTAAESPAGATDDPGRPEVEVSIAIRTILLVAGAAAIAWALASIGEVLLVIFVSFFSVAVLLPVVNVMERRLRWSRGVCSTVLVVGIVIVIGSVVLVLVQAMSSAVRDFSHDLPQIVDKVRHTAIWAASSTAGATQSTR
jgi:predicted PurR-regulated permease PerM